MITRSVKLQLLVFLLISLTGMAYAGARYADLDRFFTDQGYKVAADFVDSGGIFKGAEVTYRGVPVGEVSDLQLLPDGVRVQMLLRPGTDVPSDTRAQVGNRSAVGEQYVDLLPQRDGKPFLDAGDVIPRQNTSIPIQPTELLVNLDDFVTSIDTDDLAVVLDELGAAFDDGTGESLQRLVDSGDRLTKAATEALPETIALIRDGNTVLDTQNQTSGQFRSFNRDLRSLTRQLRDQRPRLPLAVRQRHAQRERGRGRAAGQPHRPAGAAGQPDLHRAGPAGPPAGAAPDPGDLPQRRRRRVHGHPGRRHRPLRLRHRQRGAGLHRRLPVAPASGRPPTRATRPRTSRRTAPTATARPASAARATRRTRRARSRSRRTAEPSRTRRRVPAAARPQRPPRGPRPPARRPRSASRSPWATTTRRPARSSRPTAGR